MASFFSGVISWVILGMYYYNSYVLPEAYGGEVMDDAIWDSIYISSTPAFAISVVFFIVVSLLTQKIDPPKILTDLEGVPVDRRNTFAWDPPLPEVEEREKEEERLAAIVR
jgi:Na+/proline symporter